MMRTSLTSGYVTRFAEEPFYPRATLQARIRKVVLTVVRPVSRWHGEVAYLVGSGVR